MQTFFRQSKQFLRPPKVLPVNTGKKSTSTQTDLLEYVLKNSQKGNPVSVINTIDQFCQKTWMMNLGPEKGDVVKKMGFHKNVSKVLEIGGYCGYSALVFANQIKDRQNAQVYTIQINENFANIARKIHQHAGIQNKIHIHLGTVATSLNFIKQKGPFDLIFIDHVKGLYLEDFLLLGKNGAVKKGTVVVGDNIIYPGAPQYLKFFKQNKEYQSTLYHSYLQYSNDPDAVLISTKL